MSRGGNSESKVYVGGLTEDTDEKELERTFSYYGRLRNVWVARRPPGFAFIEFEDHRDAADAVKALDGTTVCGVRVRVEHSAGRGRGKSSRGAPRGGRADRIGRGNDKCFECGEPGHLAYECRRRRERDSRGGGRRSRSRSPRSRSRSRSKRSYSRSRSRSVSRSRSRSYGRTNGRK